MQAPEKKVSCLFQRNIRLTAREWTFASTFLTRRLPRTRSHPSISHRSHRPNNSWLLKYEGRGRRRCPFWASLISNKLIEKAHRAVHVPYPPPSLWIDGPGALIISWIDVLNYWSLPRPRPIIHAFSKQTRRMKMFLEVLVPAGDAGGAQEIYISSTIPFEREYQIMRVLNISLAWWNMHCSPEWEEKCNDLDALCMRGSAGENDCIVE